MKDPFVQDLLNHPAVAGHGDGISSADLASFHDVLMHVGYGRFRRIGKDQYASLDGGCERQKFEDMSEDELILGLIEEIVDCQNYMTMLTIKKLASIRKAGAV